jgi:hypothetical protein
VDAETAPLGAPLPQPPPPHRQARRRLPERPQVSAAAPTQPDSPAPPDGLQQSDENVAIARRDWDKEWKHPFLVALARTRNASAAARAVGVNRQYAYEERLADRAFMAAWREALDVGADLLEQVAWRRGTVGEPVRVVTTKTKRDGQGAVVEEEVVVRETTRVSDRLLEVQLRAARPEVYGDRLTLAGDPDAPVQVEVGPRVRTVERLAQLWEIAREAGLPADVPARGELPATGA